MLVAVAATYVSASVPLTRNFFGRYGRPAFKQI